MLKKNISYFKSDSRVHNLKVTVLFLFFILLLPIYLLFYPLAILFSLIPIFNTRTARKNISEKLNITGLKAVFFIAQLYMNYVYYVVEVFILNPLRISYCSMENNMSVVELLHQAKKQSAVDDVKDADKTNETNPSFVFIVPHMANIEMYADPVFKTLKKLNAGSLYALAQPTQVNLINKFLFWYRKSRGLKVIWTDKNVVKNLNVAVQSQGNFCLLVDQKPKGAGVFIRFFNEFAAFPTAGLKFFMNKRYIVIHGAAYRIIPGWQKLELKIGQNSHLQANLTASENLAQEYLPKEVFGFSELSLENKEVARELSCFVNWLEKKIAQYPVQWCWDYRRWSRKPR